MEVAEGLGKDVQNNGVEVMVGDAWAVLRLETEDILNF